MKARLALLLGPPLLLAGCGWVSIEPRGPATGPAPEPAAVQSGPIESAPLSPTPASPMPGRQGMPAQSITVRPGDTVYRIARERNVPVRALIAANGLQPPYSIRPGQTLTLPPSQAMHTVQPGETLYAVSRQYGADVTAIARANGLQPPYGLQSGQQLLIPGAPASVAEAYPAPPSGMMPPPRSVDQRPDAVQVETVQLAPPPPRPTVPPGVGVPPPSSAPVAAGAPPPPSVPTSSLAGAVASVPAPAVKPSGRSGSTFLRPVAGPILAPFGPRPGGLHNDGINIRVAKGTPVHAAAAGTVAYAGNELPGYGNLVLIKHADGWVSAYGHNDELLVKRGETVARGQIIAKVGQSGNVSEPQLHFELRKGARAVDPVPYLTNESASN